MDDEGLIKEGDRDQAAVIRYTTKPSIYLHALNTTFVPTLKPRLRRDSIRRSSTNHRPR